jgi:hypothetical protein
MLHPLLSGFHEGCPETEAYTLLRSENLPDDPLIVAPVQRVNLYGHAINRIPEASYPNYRYGLNYYQRDTSSDWQPSGHARFDGGGQFSGATRFMDWLDDWPLTEYLYGLWTLGRKDDFLLSLYGHIAYSQCEGHLTAYEQMSFPGDPQGSRRADYCLPCQLVAARAGRLINKS